MTFRLDSSSFASRYASVMPLIERFGLSEVRSRLLSSVSGNVLEVGAGTGLSYRHYPEGIHLVMTEPDPAMFEILERNVAQGSVELMNSQISDLYGSDLEPHSFDYVVSTLVLCSVDDVAQSLQTISLFLKPGSKYIFMEHGLASGFYGITQRLATPIWRKVAGGCHLDRNLPGYFDSSPLVVTDLDYFRFPLGRPLIPFGFSGIARLKSDFMGSLE